MLLEGVVEMSRAVETRTEHDVFYCCVRLSEQLSCIFYPCPMEMLYGCLSSECFHAFVQLSTSEVHQLGTLFHGEILFTDMGCHDMLKAFEEFPVFHIGKNLG